MKNNFNCSSAQIEDRSGWNQLLLETNTSVYFSWEYINAIKDNYPNGINLVKVWNKDGGVLICFTSRSLDGAVWDIFSPYGMDGISTWGTNKLEALKELNHYLEVKCIVTYYLYVHPIHFISDTSFSNPSRTVYLLDISASIDNLWQKLHPNHRYEINKFNKTEHELTETNPELTQSFIELYGETLKRVNANEVYNFSSETLQKLMNLDCSYSLGVRIKDKIECVVLFLVWNDNAEYFINASSNNGRNASRTLIWEAIKRLKSMGVKKINLGGGVHEGDNLDNFKRRFGGDPAFLGVFKGISSKKEYERLCRDKNVPLSAEDYFPPYWSRKNG